MTASIQILAAQIQAAAQAANGNLTLVEEEIAALEGRTCTGSVYWRDGAGAAPKMVVVHRKGASCPLHGDPRASEDRIRTYVGVDPQKQLTSTAAIDAEQRRQQLEAHVRTIHGRLREATGHLNQTLRLLR